MNRRRKVTFVAGGAAIAALVVGLGAAGAIAASRMLSPSEESKAVIDDAAAQLGVKPQALSDALKQALKNRVDEAVDAGALTKEAGRRAQGADRVRRVPAALRRHGGGGPFGRGFGRSRPLRDPRDRFCVSRDERGAISATALDDKTLADRSPRSRARASPASSRRSSRRRRSGSTRRSPTDGSPRNRPRS